MSAQRQVATKLIIVVISLPLIAAVFCGLLTAAYSIDNSAIRSHITNGMPMITETRANNGRLIDALTECTGLSAGLFQQEWRADSAFIRAIRAEAVLGCEQLSAALPIESSPQTTEYFRYWHGYSVLTRPILSVLPYSDLRGHFMTISILLLGIFLWRVGIDFGPSTALAFGLPFVVLNALGFWILATKSVTWFLIIGGGIYMSRRQSQAVPLIAFYILGVLTAFFDFFTTPALVFAFPAFVLALYYKRGGNNVLTWRKLFAAGVFFAVGYIGLWTMKFMIAAAVLETPIWQNVIDAALIRIRGDAPQIDGFWPGSAIYKNFLLLKNFWGAVALIVFIIMPISSKQKRLQLVNIWREDRTLIAIAGIPLVWLEVLANHSHIHAHFTHLNFSVAFILAGTVVFVKPGNMSSGALPGKVSRHQV